MYDLLKDLVDIKRRKKSEKRSQFATRRKMKNWLSKTKTNFVRRPITHFEGITKQPQKPHLKKTMITKLKLLNKKGTQLPKKYIEAKRSVKIF